MKPKKRVRKIHHYLIAKDIQLRMILTNFLYLCLISLVLILTILSPYFYDIFKNDELWVQYLSAKMFIVLLDRLTIVLPLIFIFSFIHFIILTHRFCGPMINIKNTIEEIAKGNFTRKVCLRKNDFLKEEAKAMNHMIDQLSGRFEDIKEENHKLLIMVEEKLAANKQDLEINSILNEVKEKAMHAREILDTLIIDRDKHRTNLSPSIRKYDDVHTHSGLSAE